MLLKARLCLQSLDYQPSLEATGQITTCEGGKELNPPWPKSRHPTVPEQEEEEEEQETNEEEEEKEEQQEEEQQQPRTCRTAQGVILLDICIYISLLSIWRSYSFEGCFYSGPANTYYVLYGSASKNNKNPDPLGWYTFSE